MVFVYDLCVLFVFRLNVTGFCLRFGSSSRCFDADLCGLRGGVRGFCEWTCMCLLEGSCQIASFRKLPQRRRDGAAVRANGFCLFERGLGVPLFAICVICSIAIKYKESLVN